LAALPTIWNSFFEYFMFLRTEPLGICKAHLSYKKPAIKGEQDHIPVPDITTRGIRSATPENAASPKRQSHAIHLPNSNIAKHHF
jgi:hypothetical protein